MNRNAVGYVWRKALAFILCTAMVGTLFLASAPGNTYAEEGDTPSSETETAPPEEGDAADDDATEDGETGDGVDIDLPPAEDASDDEADADTGITDEPALDLEPGDGLESLEDIELFDDTAGMNVEVHTKQDIRAFVNASGAKLSDPVTYSANPSLTPPYAAGKLSTSTLNSALAILNQVRYIAGIDADVGMTTTYNSQEQAAALVNAALGTLSHTPPKPAGMSQSLYELGYTGASTANLAAGYPTLGYAIVAGWMNDGDAGNIQMVGHRRWILNPGMKNTGFGMVSNPSSPYGAFSAMKSFDTARESSYAGVAWPAQYMPLDYFDGSFPWSISLGKNVSKSAVTVKLTRTNDNKKWTFKSGVSSSVGYFNVNNSGYGQSGCIIFRPANITYKLGDSFHVEITGVDPVISYDVNFFPLNAKPISDSGVTATLSSASSTYKGAEIKPTLKLTDSGRTMKADRDYTFVYSSNINAGTGKVKVTGIGDYKGTRTITFTIKPKSISSAATNTIENQTYNGTSFKPAVEVTNNLGTLVLDKDYTLKYAGNKNAGKAKITITGKGNYTGTLTKNFIIEKAEAPEITWPVATPVTYGKALSKSKLSAPPETSPYGTFKWTKGTTVPTVVNEGYSVTFVPNTGTVANYEPVTPKKKDIDILVNKAAAPKGVPKTVYGTQHEYVHQFNLKSLLPKIDGLTGVVYLPETTEDEYGILGALEYTGGDILEIPQNAADIGKKAKITVTISSDNYFDFTSVITITVNGYALVFDAAGGSEVMSKTVKIGSALGTLPKSAKVGYSLTGWYKALSGGKKITTKTKPRGDMTYYAHWTAKKYTITFNVNGGKALSAKTKTVRYDKKYGALKTPKRTGYIFDGWFTEKTAGDQILPEDIVKITKNKTLYAHWTAKS